ncbi:hypothetical protein Purlil1_1671 [Purpureocillium lilacinum]|uniref:GPI anchored serine-threonine rich protein n=1 Tax=Purpureocillium lilacinum TaxID=33203 RepID=A0ABR0CD20_PURLI|nr:hypothetical protein Purlil1_1671 [Purpureocillium lilacinum]
MLVFCVIILSCTATCLADLAFPAAELLVERAPSFGGFALIADPCPADLTKCNIRGRCCPANTACRDAGAGNAGFACCPTVNNCVAAVNAAPACAADGWVLWKSNTGYFCCLPNQVGIKVAAAVGSCVPSNVPVPLTQSATKVPAAGATSSTGQTTLSHASTATTTTLPTGASVTTAPTTPTGTTATPASPTPTVGGATSLNFWGSGGTAAVIVGFVAAGFLACAL